MVEDLLVGPNIAQAHRLIAILDQNDIPIQAALWVLSPDHGGWRLWLTPDHAPSDERAFFMKMAGIIARNRPKLRGFDIGEIELVAADHPAIEALRAFYGGEAEASISLSKQMLNGYFLPAAVILRLP